MSVAEESWYRNRIWNLVIEEQFFAKLARSRCQREQYLVIQALTIARTYPEVTLQLIDNYFSTKTNDHDDIRALNAKAEAYLAKNHINAAITAMKAVLEIEKIKPGQKTLVFVDYPYLVATLKIKSEYTSALLILKERVTDLTFPVSIFMWNSAMSLISSEANDIVRAKHFAGAALDAAKIKKTGFQFYQKLGLVGSEHKATIAKLKKIYA
jgi:hypothetical protein